MQNRKNNRSGFTLIELLVVIAISGMIFLSVSALLIALFASNTRITQLDLLQQAKNDLQAELSNAIRWSRSVTISGANDVLDVENADLSHSVYQIDSNRRLAKNGVPLVGNDVAITSFSVRNLSVSPAYASLLLLVSLNLQSSSFVAVHDTMNLVVSQRASTTASP